VQTFLNKAKELAVYIRIELKPAQEAMIGAESLAKILLAIHTSFLNFVDAEIYNSYSKPTPALKKETKLFLAATKLCVADADFTKLTFALVPDLSTANYTFKVLTNFAALKEAYFKLFVDTVFTDTIFNAAIVKKITEKYSAKQRISIFKPVCDELINQDEFVIYFGKGKSSHDKTWIKTEDQAVLTSLVPEAVKQSKEAVETYYQLVKTGEENDLFGKRSTYKKVLVKETVGHDIYPYQIKKVKVGHNTIFLNRQLSAEVMVKAGLYQISFAELHIVVKEQQRADAEKAFDIALARLIDQFTKGNLNGNDQKSKTIVLKLQELLT
jgi:hypothetical protein